MFGDRIVFYVGLFLSILFLIAFFVFPIKYSFFIFLIVFAIYHLLTKKAHLEIFFLSFIASIGQSITVFWIRSVDNVIAIFFRYFFFDAGVLFSSSLLLMALKSLIREKHKDKHLLLLYISLVAPLFLKARVEQSYMVIRARGIKPKRIIFVLFGKALDYAKQLTIFLHSRFFR